MLLRRYAILMAILILLSASGCHWLQPPPTALTPLPSAPQGARVYVTDHEGHVVALRVDDNTVAEKFPVEQGAGCIVVSPDDLYVYATAKEKDYVRVFHTDGQPLPRIKTDKKPYGLALTRDGRQAIVTHPDANSITVLDLKPHGKQTRRFASGRKPMNVAMSPDDKRFFVLLHDDNAVAAYNSKTGKEIARATVGVDPFGMTVDPGGKYVYATSFDTNELIVLDAGKLTEVARVHIGEGPYSVVATRDGNVYVGCVEDGTVARIARDDWKADPRSTRVGNRPYGMATSPDEKTLYVALEGDARVTVRSLPDLDEKTLLDLNIMPVGVFSGR